MSSATPRHPADEEAAAPSSNGALVDAHATGQPSPSLATDPAPESLLPLDEIDDWADRAEKCFAAARAARTPEAWREAGQLSFIVADVTFALQIELAARRYASEAARNAQERAKVAAAALQTAQRASIAARDVHNAVASARSSGTAESWQAAARVASAISRAPITDVDEVEHLRQPGEQPAQEPSGQPGTVTQINPMGWPATTRRRAWRSSDS